MPDSLVSIIIPVYNGSDYLKEAIDSALGQTYKNIEVLVVNDGSEDSGQTELIAKSYGNQIRYFYKENGGTASALNLGLKKMMGDWFAWLSHDDLFSDNRIEEDMLLCRKIPEAKIFFCRSKTIDANGRVISEKEYSIHKVTNPREALILGGVGMCSMTIHKSCFSVVGLFNEDNRTNHDIEMVLRLSNVVPFFFNKNAVVYRRDHPNRGTYLLSKQRQNDLLLLCNYVYNELSINDFFPDLGSEENDITKSWIWMGNWYRKHGATRYANECYKNAISAQKKVYNRWKKSAKILIKKLEIPILNKLIICFFKVKNKWDFLHKLLFTL